MGRKRQADPTQRTAITQAGHVGLFPQRPVTRPFDAAIRAVAPGPISYKNLLELFKGRASRASIHAWRFGTRNPPAWAVEILRAELNARRAVFDMLAESIRPGPGMGWNKNATRGLGEWRAKKNAKTD